MAWYLWVVAVVGVIIAGLKFWMYSKDAALQAKCETKVAKYKLTRPSEWKGKKFLSLVNPYGGNGHCLDKIYKKIVVPMFEKAGINSELVVTKHANHATEIASTCDLSKYDAILILSGDGMVHEVVNALGNRGTNDTNDSKGLEATREIYSQVPLAVVPGGSANGFVAGLGSFDAFEAVKKIIEGTARPFDLLSIEPYHDNNNNNNNDNNEKKKQKKNDNDDYKSNIIWDPMIFSWALLADIDDLVEDKIRWMGNPLKDTVAGLVAGLRNKRYYGDFIFKPCHDRLPSDLLQHYGDQTQLDDDPGRAGWKKISGGFFAITASNVTHAAKDAIVCPNASPYSGDVDVCVIRDPSLCEVASIADGLEKGTHIDQPSVSVYKCTEFILIPKDNKAGVGLDLSGKLYPTQAVHVKKHQGIAKFIH